HAVLGRRELGGDAADQAADELAAEVGELARQLDPEVVHYPGEGAIEHAQGREVDQQFEDAAEPAAETGLDLVPKAAEEALDRLPVAIDQVGAYGDGGNQQADGVEHQRPA